MSTRSGRSRPSALESSPSRPRKGVSPPRSPGRRRKASPPAQSPSRKSPGRKSPSRKPASKFPARKSPSRSTKETNEIAAQKLPSARPSIKITTSKSVEVSAAQKKERETRLKRSEYTIKDLSVDLSQFEVNIGDKINGLESNFTSKDLYGLRNRHTAEYYIPRRSSRLREFIDNDRKSVSKSASKSSISKSVDFSDGDNSEEEIPKKDKDRSSTSISRKLVTPLAAKISGQREFGGRIGSSILLILLPLTMFMVITSYTESCPFKAMNKLISHRDLSWFSALALTFVALQATYQALLSRLPILGTKADRMDDSGEQFCFNAFFSSILAVTIIFVLDFFKIIDSNLILNEYRQLAIASYILAVVLSIILFLKSRKLDVGELNTHGNTGYVLYDFWMGREIHPFLFKLDVKIWISRVCNINALILAVLLFKHGVQVMPSKLDTPKLGDYQDYLRELEFKPTILIFSMMQIIYLLSFIMREQKITATFYWHSEGVGYLQIVSSALYPYYYTCISKNIVDKNIELSTNVLIAASVLYLSGFLILFMSSNIKYEFRKNPLNPSFANLDIMPTFHGKKLLVTGPWGILRHPNYTGDILIHLALALPGLLSKSLAAAPALLTVAVLLHRAWRDHARCQRRYGAAWHRYCKRVPSVIIPKIL